MLESMITRKGQVTIPEAIRDRLGVKEGEKVIFVMRGEEVVLCRFVEPMCTAALKFGQVV